MIYLIDRGFRIKSAFNTLVNQCKYPGIYNECFCLNCSRGDVNDNVNVNDNDNYLRSSFANNDNVNDNVNDNDNDNVNDNDLRSSFANNDNDNDNDRDNFIYQGTCFADLFNEKIKGVNPIGIAIVIALVIVLLKISVKRFHQYL